MNPEDVGKEVVVIISEHHGNTETVRGFITSIIDEYIFEVTDNHGNISRWNERQIKGIKFKGEG